MTDKEKVIVKKTISMNEFIVEEINSRVKADPLNTDFSKKACELMLLGMSLVKVEKKGEVS